MKRYTTYLYELTGINIVTRSTGIHILHITGICPWWNMPVTFYKHVLEHCLVSLHKGPHIIPKKTKKCNTYFMIYCHICASYNKPIECHMYATHANKLTSIYGEIYQYICCILNHLQLKPPYVYFANYNLPYCQILMNKYGRHIAFMCPIVLLL